VPSAMARCGRKLASGACLAGAVYALVLRPRLVRWGATDEEVAGTFPGKELIPDGKRAATMAITIEAPPAKVGPWLVQMGWGRAGWYSWDRLDNGGRPSAHELHPEWQELSVGDYLSAWSPGGPMDAWEVAALEPDRFLGLRGLSDLRGHVLDPRPNPDRRPTQRGSGASSWRTSLTTARASSLADTRPSVHDGSKASSTSGSTRRCTGRCRSDSSSSEPSSPHPTSGPSRSIMAAELHFFRVGDRGLEPLTSAV
jgi:hypothetical protein